METQNSKSETREDAGKGRFDLEERTLSFALAVRAFVRKLSRDPTTLSDGPQVLRSSGSVGANYIEANEALSKKDFIVRIKICRKEAKETGYWLKLIDPGAIPSLVHEKEALIGESRELTAIFGAILRKSERTG
jgi:four helix bundle protein